MNDKVKPEAAPMTAGAFTAVMAPMLKRQVEAFAKLEARIAALEVEVANLKAKKK